MIEIALVLAIGALLLVVLITDVRLFAFATISYVLLFPKIGILAVPGTWVAIRGEDLLIALLVVRLIIDIASRRIVPFDSRVRRIVLCYFLLLPIGAVGLLVGIEIGSVQSPAVGLLFYLRKFEYFALFVAAYVYLRDDARAAQWMMNLLKFSVVFHGTFSLLQTAGVLGGFRQGASYGPLPADQRALSTFSGAYELGGFMVLVAPAFVWALVKSKNRISALIYLVIIFVTVLLTQSRSSIVALLAVVAAMLFVLLRGYRPLVALASMIGGAVLAVTTPEALTQGRFASLDPSLMIAESIQAWERRSYEFQAAYGTTVSALSTDLSFSHRAGKWFNYIDGVLRLNPFFGLGPSAGGEAVDGNYVRLYLEFGLLGLIVTCLTIGLIWRALRATSGSPLKAVAAWGGLSLLLQAFFIDIFEASKVAESYWFILGTVFATGLLGRKAHIDGKRTVDNFVHMDLSSSSAPRGG